MEMSAAIRCHEGCSTDGIAPDLLHDCKFDMLKPCFDKAAKGRIEVS